MKWNSYSLQDLRTKSLETRFLCRSLVSKRRFFIETRFLCVSPEKAIGIDRKLGESRLTRDMGALHSLFAAAPLSCYNSRSTDDERKSRHISLRKKVH